MQSLLTGVERIVYIVKEENLRLWAAKYCALGGRIIGQRADIDTPASVTRALRRVIIEFPEFEIELQAGVNGTQDSSLVAEVQKFGEHCLSRVMLRVEWAGEHIQKFRAMYDTLSMWEHAPALHDKIKLVSRNPQRLWNEDAQQAASLKRVDHLTFPVPVDQMDSRRAFWEALGGEAQEVKTVGTYPADKMILQGIFFNKGVPGKEFGIALVAGIDGKEELSQLTKFLRANGPDQVQHVAYDVGDMAVFCSHFTTIGGNLLAEPIVAPDGAVQAFGWPYSGRNAAVGQYPEFLAHKIGKGVNFQQVSLDELHAMVKNASKRKPRQLFSNCPPPSRARTQP